MQAPCTQNNGSFLAGIRHITYRGSISSCNYSCSYCPFAKRTNTPAQQKQDWLSLQRFTNQIASTSFDQPISILITPYGEAMLHTWYWDALAALSRLPQVQMISCQTNLSFDTTRFLQTLTHQQANLSKIALWATYHPSMVTMDAFWDQLQSLTLHIQFCVGMVGDPQLLPDMQAMKQHLLPDHYLWINRMDGLGRACTAHEVMAFTELDPLYPLEHKDRYPTANPLACTGGRQSLFITADGTAYPCNRSHTKLGNLYQEESASAAANASILHPLLDASTCHGRCDCFLAYSNRKDLMNLMFLSPAPQLRLHQKKPFQAIFFDIDDSVYFPNHPDKTKTAAQTLAHFQQQGSLLFPVTALTYEAARRRICQLNHLLSASPLTISGGVFAYGADLRIGSCKHIVTLSGPTDPDTLYQDSLPAFPERPHRVFFHQGQPYKILVNKTSPCKHQWSRFGILYEEEQTTLVPFGTSKEAGTKWIMDQLSLTRFDILTIGNSEADRCFLDLAACSIAPDTAAESLHKAVRYIWNSECQL